jgi:arginase
MKVALIHVPYHLGHEGVGMGAGPTTLLAAGLTSSLTDGGHDADVFSVRREGAWTNEIAASFAVLRLVADRVREAVAEDAFPLALAGNCMTSIGVVAGLGRALGVVWLDAHPDFNTAEGTESGFADGMGLSILTGTGWDAMRATVPGYRALAEANVVLVGIRDVAAAERERLRTSPIRVVAPDALDGVTSALDGLREQVSEVYFHLDLDVLDPSEGRANEYAAAGGLNAGDVERLIEAVGDRFRIRAASVTAYDPLQDPEGLIPPTAIRLSSQIVEAAAREAVGAP